jgi:Protein of unknown function with PCYCGC motif
VVTKKMMLVIGGIFLIAGAFGARGAMQGQTQSHSAPMAMTHGAQADNSATEPIPAYHVVPSSAAENEKTLDPEDFAHDPVTRNAYAMAAKVKKVLYQQPCYCYCDHSQAHTSLLSCYTGDHAAYCEVCKKEAIYAYEQTKQHKTAKQIRAGIIHGEWQKIDLAQYKAPQSY